MIPARPTLRIVVSGCGLRLWLLDQIGARFLFRIFVLSFAG